MDKEKVATQLIEQGLRIASEKEPGYTWTYINEYGERATLWVTYINNG